MPSTTLPAPLPEFITIAPEVGHALRTGLPVVALESAVISHGLPQPTAIESAAAVEREVRRGGAIPATVALIDGRLVIGAGASELARLTGPGVTKVAERDLAVAVAQRATGGATVSATTAAAATCGIAVMSTGGLGGVHLGVEQSWDVSADLPALARWPVLAVCAGIKAICDVPKTLEYLETLGVPVLAYGTDRFPYFYAQDSGQPAPQRIDTPGEAAAVLAARRALGQRGGVVVARPVPEEYALTASAVDEAVREAVRRSTHVHGRDLTPALLAALTEITGGRTLRANLALLRANAALASAISRAVHRNGFARAET